MQDIFEELLGDGGGLHSLSALVKTLFGHRKEQLYNDIFNQILWFKKHGQNNILLLGLRPQAIYKSLLGTVTF